MTHYTHEQIENMLDDLRAILDVRARWNNTYQSVSADYDMEDKVIVIRWFDHVDPEMRKHDIDRRVYIPVQGLYEEVARQREKLFEDLSDEDMQVLTDVLLNYGTDFESTK